MKKIQIFNETVYVLLPSFEQHVGQKNYIHRGSSQSSSISQSLFFILDHLLTYQDGFDHILNGFCYTVL